MITARLSTNAVLTKRDATSNKGSDHARGEPNVSAVVRIYHSDPMTLHHRVPRARPARSLRLLLLSLPVALALGAGCAEAPPPARAVAQPAEIGRDNAVYAAAYDAQTRFGIQNLTPVFVNRTGEVWVVELSSADGAQVHYAIGAFDGSVRERHVRR